MAPLTSADRERWIDELHRNHASAVRSFLRGRCGHGVDLDEVVADVFFVAWRRIDGLDHTRPKRPWLYAIARRVLANHQRAAGRRAQLAQRVRAVDRPPPTPSPELPDHVAAVRLALAKLRPADRRLLLLLAEERLKPSEIGDRDGIPAAAVRTRALRARAALREALADEGELSAREPDGSAP